MITRIEAYQYRCFSKIDVALDRYHVLAGANGAGKTTFLDIPALFSDLLNTRMASAAFLEKTPSRATPRAVAPRELAHRMRSNYFSLVLETKLPGDITSKLLELDAGKSGKYEEDPKQWPTGLRYEVQFEIFNDVEIHIAGEYLILFPIEGTRPPHGEGIVGDRSVSYKKPRFTVIHRNRKIAACDIIPEFTSKKKALTLVLGPQQLALAEVPADATQFPAATWFKTFLREQCCFYAPDLPKLRSASPPGSGKRLSADGGNLPWLVLDFQENDPDGFAEWNGHVRLAIPGVKDIRAVLREEDRHAYFRVRYRNGMEVTSSGLSDGTLRILSLTALPYLITPPALVMTEEPENGIHPRAIDAVLESLKAMYDSQVWISTHSPVVLANTELSRILCMRLKDDESVEAVRGNEHPQLKEWKGGLDLGTLFAAGVFG